MGKGSCHCWLTLSDPHAESTSQSKRLNGFICSQTRSCLEMSVQMVATAANSEFLSWGERTIGRGGVLGSERAEYWLRGEQTQVYGLWSCLVFMVLSMVLTHENLDRGVCIGAWNWESALTWEIQRFEMNDSIAHQVWREQPKENLGPDQTPRITCETFPAILNPQAKRRHAAASFKPLSQMRKETENDSHTHSYK